MTRLAQVVFALLVVSAFGAFFAAQELKSAPSVVQRFQIKYRVISPNRDGRFDRQRVSFRLKRADTVDVAVVDDQGDTVKELASGLRMAAYAQLTPSLVWDGTDERGREVPDGTYRVRITLRDQGRNVIVPRAFRVDRTAPVPVVASVGPERGRGPELLPRPDGKPARIRLQAPARRGRLLIFRTWPRPPELVRTIAVPDGETLISWDGRADDGRRAAPGTYVVVAETRDVAGNIGTSVPLDADGLPSVPYGQTLPGRGGITVRRLVVQPPLLPVRAGRRVTIGVDARRRSYAWTVRRVGAEPLREGTATRPLVAVRTPAANSGAYVFTARRGSHTASAAFGVDDRARHKVLVVLPLMTWQGRNPVDDDGDGEPNLLIDGRDVRLGRVLGTRAPVGFAAREAPTLAWLDRNRHRYDITTDVALALNAGPKLSGHSGVLLAGDAVWLPPVVQKRLRRFVTAGGTLASMGTGSLQRQVRLTGRLRLIDPTPPSSADIFGSRIAPLRRGTVDLTNARDDIDLFRETEGEFRGFTGSEETLSPGRAKLLSSAVDADGRAVIVALRVGRGTVIRFGLPELPQRLDSDPDVQGLMDRTWQLLSR